MRFFLTNAKEHLAAQPDPEISLGGYASSTELPNGYVNGLFATISQSLINSNGKETKMIALRNETGATVAAGTKLYYETVSETPYTNIKMAVVAPSVDGCDDPIFETIPNYKASPVTGTFFNNKTEDNAIVLPEIAQGAFLGVWVERTINSKNAGVYTDCEAMAETLELETVPQITQITSIADIAGSLDGKYFLFNTVESAYYVWFTNGTATDPLIEDRQGVKVMFVNGDSAVTMTAKMKTSVDLMIGESGEVLTELIAATPEVLQITNCANGLADVPSDTGNTGFTFVVTQQGLSTELEKLEAFDIFIDYP